MPSMRMLGFFFLQERKKVRAPPDNQSRKGLKNCRVNFPGPSLWWGPEIIYVCCFFPFLDKDYEVLDQLTCGKSPNNQSSSKVGPKVGFRAPQKAGQNYVKNAQDFVHFWPILTYFLGSPDTYFRTYFWATSTIARGFPTGLLVRRFKRQGWWGRKRVAMWVRVKQGWFVILRLLLVFKVFGGAPSHDSQMLRKEQHEECQFHIPFCVPQVLVKTRTWEQCPRMLASKAQEKWQIDSIVPIHRVAMWVRGGGYRWAREIGTICPFGVFPLFYSNFWPNLRPIHVAKANCGVVTFSRKWPILKQKIL